MIAKTCLTWELVGAAFAVNFILLTALQATTGTDSAKHNFKITILYDNYVFKPGTKAGWGFACLIESAEKTILFDTGGSAEILWHNIRELQVDVAAIDKIVLSHNHWDHTGGFDSLVKEKQQISVYAPQSFPAEFTEKVKQSKNVLIRVSDPAKIDSNIYLTGEMGQEIKEQSLILDTPKGLVIITGCSHQGIVNILERAKNMLNKNIYLVVGGFHLLRHSDEGVQQIIEKFRQLGVQKCGATHCTGDRQIEMFKNAYGENYEKIGTGKIIIVSDE